MASRRELALEFGAVEAFDPRDEDLEERVKSHDRRPRSGPGDRGRFGARDRRAGGGLFAARARGFCCLRKLRIRSASKSPAPTSAWASGRFCGSYSASVDLQKESADLVFSGALPVEELISHRFPLNDIHEGIERALHPDEESLKIVVQPQR